MQEKAINLQIFINMNYDIWKIIKAVKTVISLRLCYEHLRKAA